MSQEEIPQNEQIPEDETLMLLKEKATNLGITFHPSIGIEKLQEKINEAIMAKAEEAKKNAEATQGGAAPAVQTAQAVVINTRREALKLVRCRIVCMNPAKKEWEGEIISAGNRVIGTVRKFVAFNVPYHIPQIILNQLRQRECQIFHTVTDERGNKVRRGKLIPEFGIEILPPLNEKELKELAQRQAMAAGTAV